MSFFCHKEEPQQIVLFKGDDTDFLGNSEIFIEVSTELDISNCVAHFKLLSIERTWETIPENHKFILSFSKEELENVSNGLNMASFWLVDTNNKKRTIDNRIKFLITNNIKEAYGDKAKGIKVVFGNVIHWEDIIDAPKFVKKVNGTEPDEDGNVNVEVPELEWNNIKNKPNLVKSVNGVTPDENGNVKIEVVSEVNWEDVKNKPTEFPPTEHEHTIADVTSLQAELNSKISENGGTIDNIFYLTTKTDGPVGLIVKDSDGKFKILLSDISTEQIAPGLEDGVIQIGRNQLYLPKRGWIKEGDSSRLILMALDVESKELHPDVRAVISEVARTATYPVPPSETARDDDHASARYTAGMLAGKASQQALNNLADEVSQIKASARPNITVIGNPTISGGSVSGFSANDYLVFPSTVDIGNATVEFDLTVQTGSQVTNQENILDSWCGLALAIQNGEWVLAVSTDGVTFANVGRGGVVLPNTPHRLRISFSHTLEGGHLVTLREADGEGGYTEPIIAMTLPAHIYPKPLYFGGANPASGVHHIFTGVINIGACSMTFNGTQVWNGWFGVIPPHKHKAEDITDFKNAIKYAIVSVGTDGVLTDRAINTTSAATVSLPSDYSDLVIRATVTNALNVTVPDGVTKYGDAFPAETGEFLVTITKTGAREIYVRTLKIEEVA